MFDGTHWVMAGSVAAKALPVAWLMIGTPWRARICARQTMVPAPRPSTLAVSRTASADRNQRWRSIVSGSLLTMSVWP
jgi:hypothetical protein